jgi:hypothetical protein
MGIDPGSSGAFAIIDERFEVVELEKFKSMMQVFTFIKKNEIKGICIEQVGIRPGTNSKASETFMKNFGGLLAIAEICGCKRISLTPKQWQPRSGVVVPAVSVKGLEKKLADKLKREKRKRIKAKSIDMAQKFFGLDMEISDDEADALHLARIAVDTFHR